RYPRHPIAGPAGSQADPEQGRWSAPAQWSDPGQHPARRRVPRPAGTAQRPGAADPASAERHRGPARRPGRRQGQRDPGQLRAVHEGVRPCSDRLALAGAGDPRRRGRGPRQRCGGSLLSRQAAGRPLLPDLGSARLQPRAEPARSPRPDLHGNAGQLVLTPPFAPRAVLLQRNHVPVAAPPPAPTPPPKPPPPPTPPPPPAPRPACTARTAGSRPPLRTGGGAPTANPRSRSSTTPAATPPHRPPPAANPHSPHRPAPAAPPVGAPPRCEPARPVLRTNPPP